MTTQIDLDRSPATTAKPRRAQKWLTAAGAVVAVSAAGAAYVYAQSGNDPLPPGAHEVRVYTVDDSLSSTVDRPNVIERLLLPCGADGQYLEVSGQGMCAVLNGSLGTVRATGTDQGVILTGAEAAKVRKLVGDDPATRVVLEHDGGWAALLDTDDLGTGAPVTGRRVG